jgi:2-polyprenyl-6-methoxyphenol hydroxylase-like FAD-dependent oxidoreductase
MNGTIPRGTSDDRFDAVIAGGGVAGSAAAAALSRLGMQVAIIEPGLDDSRRLSGELIHQPGAAALEELGLLEAVYDGDGTPITGFSVRFGGAADSKVVHLPYGSPQSANPAFAMEHGRIRERMLAAAARLPGVHVLERSRITSVNLGSPDYAEVHVCSTSGTIVVRPRLLVGADGASSPVSRLAGVDQTRRRLSTLFGVLLESVSLPDPGFGHIFLGGSGPVLAYPVSPSAVRVMFDLPDTPAGPACPSACRASLEALPEPFRSEVGRRLDSTAMVAGASYTSTRSEITRGRLVLVGDAAGCCHPVTATGLTMCASDALRLRDALGATHGDIARALPLYARRRQGPQRTRMVAARVLYEVFCGHTPESKLVRDGLCEYWNLGSSRCAKSMALVSTADARLHVLLAELAHVIACGFGIRISKGWREGGLSARQTRILLDVSRLVLRHTGETLRTM